ncbi:MAG TPA: DUF4407 domain-containing protein [Pseudonocardiaceae bacterium]|nr:DUF4407 domain-containing protein [Pseudonocardiaceae bacterium]
MTVRKMLALIAGAQPDLAEQSGDLTKQAAMGGVLISTALVAGVSAFFALDGTLHLPWPAALGAALVWAFVILNLDRMLIVSMNGMHGIKLKLAAALPRLALAIVIGAVVSTPLTLRVFQPEIDAQLQIMHAQQITTSDQTLNTTYADIPSLENQVANLQAIISGKTHPAVADDPDVKAAQAAYNTAEQTYQTAESQAQCELNGTCGSNHAGNGQAYKNQQATADAAKQQADAANRALQAAEAKASSNLAATAAQQVADARKQLPDVQNRLTVEQAEKQAADQAALAADNANSGLLSQLEALDTITADHPTAAIAHLMLFLLFLFIEVLPVLVKLLSTLGSPSAYDDLIAQQEEHVKQAKRSTLDAERKQQEAQAEAAAEVAAHQLAEQVEQAKLAAGQVVAMQAEIAMRSMEAWKELAKKKVDAELNQWIMANSVNASAPQTRWDPEKTVELPRRDLRPYYRNN